MEGSRPYTLAPCYSAVTFAVVERQILHASQFVRRDAVFSLQSPLFSPPLTTVFRFQISMILSSSSLSPGIATLLAKASLSPQVFLDGTLLQPTADDRWSITIPQSSRSLLFVQLSGAITLLDFSFSTDSIVSPLPVRPLSLYCLLPWLASAVWFHLAQVLISGVLFSSSSQNRNVNIIPHCIFRMQFSKFVSGYCCCSHCHIFAESRQRLG